MKTLGQIAYEAISLKAGWGPDELRGWEAEASPEVRADWEAAAQAVRDAVIDECAKIAEKTVCDKHIPTGVVIYGTRAAAAIRALKGKK
jgi:hypothetical protein